MKIYFAGSIRGGRNDKELYFEIINHLQKYGEVLTEHVGNINLTESGENLPDNSIYKRDISWISEADVLVAEVSTPSIGVGYEIREAEREGKDTICLYRNSSEKKLSAMISGNEKSKIIVYDSLEKLTSEIDSYFSNLETRF